MNARVFYCNEQPHIRKIFVVQILEPLSSLETASLSAVDVLQPLCGDRILRSRHLVVALLSEPYTLRV